MDIIDMVHQLYPDDCFVTPDRVIGWAHDSMIDAAVAEHIRKYGPSDTPLAEHLYRGIANGVGRPSLEDALAHLEDTGKATFAAMTAATGATAINRMSDALRPLARACWPKEQHATRGAAEAQRRSLIRRGLHRDLARIHTYRCPDCKLPNGAPAYHVGHRG